MHTSIPWARYGRHVRISDPKTLSITFIVYTASDFSVCIGDSGQIANAIDRNPADRPKNTSGSLRVIAREHPWNARTRRAADPLGVSKRSAIPGRCWKPALPQLWSPGHPHSHQDVAVRLGQPSEWRREFQACSCAFTQCRTNPAGVVLKHLANHVTKRVQRDDELD